MILMSHKHYPKEGKFMILMRPEHLSPEPYKDKHKNPTIFWKVMNTFHRKLMLTEAYENAWYHPHIYIDYLLLFVIDRLTRTLFLRKKVRVFLYFFLKTKRKPSKMAKNKNGRP